MSEQTAQKNNQGSGSSPRQLAQVIYNQTSYNSYSCLQQACMLATYLAQLPQLNGHMSAAGWSLSVWGLRDLPVPDWVFPGNSALLPLQRHAC